MAQWHQDVAAKLADRDAHVVIVGLGYVGLPLALAAVDAGFEVTGIEIDQQRREALMRADPYIEDVPPEALIEANETGRLQVVADYDVVQPAQVVVVCVPTPLLGGVPDLSAVLASADEVARQLSPHTLVSLESTTYPGTTEDVFRPRIEAGGLTVGDDVALVFSPERIDPGNERFGIGDIPKLVGGVTDDCTTLGEAFYSTLVSKVIRLARPREAEMAKLLENTYRQVNIALINEFAMVANELDIDIWEVVDAAATKPFGFHSFYPGIGIGGHSTPARPVSLTWRIRELGRGPFRLVELAQDIDRAMPRYIARRVADALLDDGILVKGAKVFALGVTYKPDVADTRASRAVDVLGELGALGCIVSYHDPFRESIQIGDGTLDAVPLDEGLANCDIAVILTHHSTYDWAEVVAKAPRVFDARGVTRSLDDPKIVRL